MEFAVFFEGWCADGGMDSLEEAQEQRQEYVDNGADAALLTAGQVCSRHAGRQAGRCPECAAGQV